MRSTAHLRLTAVGRAAKNSSAIRSNSPENLPGAREAALRAPMARPIAAAIPIAGAPRMTISRIPRITSL